MGGDQESDRKMKLNLSPEQCAKLEIIFKAVDAGQVAVGQIRRSPHPAPDAGQFALVYTLVSQSTGRTIRAAIEKEHSKRAAKTQSEAGRVSNSACNDNATPLSSRNER